MPVSEGIDHSDYPSQRNHMNQVGSPTPISALLDAQQQAKQQAAFQRKQMEQEREAKRREDVIKQQNEMKNNAKNLVAVIKVSSSYREIQP